MVGVSKSVKPVIPFTIKELMGMEPMEKGAPWRVVEVEAGSRPFIGMNVPDTRIASI